MMNNLNWIPTLAWILVVGMGKAEVRFLTTPGSPTASEEMEGVIQTSDGNLVIAGGYDTGTDQDALIIKVDLSGNLLWAKTYGGNGNDMFTSIEATPDGGWIAAGWTTSFGAGVSDGWVVKMDGNGSIQWEFRYGGSDIDQLWSVDRDGGYYFVVGGSLSYGAGLSDLWALKLDSTGSIVWQKAYGSGGDDAPGGQFDEYVGRGVVDPNGRYVISSSTDSVLGMWDIWIAQVNPTDGALIWAKTYGDQEEDGMWALTKSSQGGYIVGGLFTDPNTFEGDAWVVQVDTGGNVLWQKTLGVTGSWDEALFVSPTSDGGALVGGYLEEQGGNRWSASLIRVNGSGTLVGATRYTPQHLDWTNAVIQLDDGSLTLVGVTTDTTTWDQNVLIAHTDSVGQVGGCPPLTSLSLNIASTSVTPHDITSLVAVTSTSATAQPTSATVTSLSIPANPICTEVAVGETSVPCRADGKVTVVLEQGGHRRLLKIQNPPSHTHRMVLYNVAGQRLREYRISPSPIIMDLSTYRKGIYFYSIHDRSGGVLQRGRIFLP